MNIHYDFFCEIKNINIIVVEYKRYDIQMKVKYLQKLKKREIKTDFVVNFAHTRVL